MKSAATSHYLNISRNFRRYLCCFLCILMLLAGVTGCRQPISKETATGFYFDTVISVTVYETDSQEASKTAPELVQHCMDMAASYEQLFSPTVKGSDVWNINHSSGAPTTISEETLKLLSSALSYAELSGGLVDPTIGTLSSLWDFSRQAEKNTQDVKVPSDSAIKEALSHVNYKAVIIDGNKVTLSDPEACIDLGFIAKGYIADHMKAYLLSEGVTSAVINLGGNVLTIGSKPDGNAYNIGIQKPFADTGTALMTLSVSDKSVVSSGNYERFFCVDDILYHHILSTTDGYPTDSDLSQVTIINSSSMDGDALSTLCFILGYQQGLELINSLPDTEAVFVTCTNEVYTTY